MPKIRAKPKSKSRSRRQLNLKSLSKAELRKLKHDVAKGWEKVVKPMKDAATASTRVTAADLAIRINTLPHERRDIMERDDAKDRGYYTRRTS